MRPLFLSSACFLSDLIPANGRNDVGGDVQGHKSPLFHPKRKPFWEKAVQTRVDSFTWDVRGPLPSEGRAWARLGYFSRPTGDLAGRAKSLIEALG